MGNFITRLAIAYTVIFFVAWATRTWTLMGPGGIVLALLLAPLDWALQRWEPARKNRLLRAGLYLALAFALALGATAVFERRPVFAAAATIAGILAGLNAVYPREMVI